MPFVPELGMNVTDPLAAYAAGQRTGQTFADAFQQAPIRAANVERLKTLAHQRQMRDVGTHGYQQDYNQLIQQGKKPIEASVEAFVKWAPYFDPAGFRTALGSIEGAEVRKVQAELREKMDEFRLQYMMDKLQNDTRIAEMREKALQAQIDDRKERRVLDEKKQALAEKKDVRDARRLQIQEQSAASLIESRISKDAQLKTIYANLEETKRLLALQAQIKPGMMPWSPKQADIDKRKATIEAEVKRLQKEFDDRAKALRSGKVQPNPTEEGQDIPTGLIQESPAAGVPLTTDSAPKAKTAQGFKVEVIKP